MKKNNRIVLGLLLALGSSMAFAQPLVGAVDGKKKEEVKKVEEVKKTEEVSKSQKASSHYALREDLIKQHGKYSGLIIGIFPGTVAVVNNTTYLNRYLPLSNYLTTTTNQLVSFSPELSVNVLKESVKKEKFNFLYVNAEIGVEALKAKYEPLVQRSEKIVSVIMARNDFPDGKLSDLVGKKIGGIPQAMVSTLARAKFKKEKVDIVIESAGATGQKDLILGLDNKILDGVVLREEVALDLIKKTPGKYRIAFTLETAPGFILFARKDVPTSMREQVVQSMIDLNPTNKSSLEILKGLDSKISTFEKITKAEVEEFDMKTKDVIAKK